MAIFLRILEAGTKFPNRPQYPCLYSNGNKFLILNVYDRSVDISGNTFEIHPRNSKHHSSKGAVITDL